MTGFGKGEAEGRDGKVVVEIKSVNHRFRDIRFRMGPLFNDQEMAMRKAIAAQFKRGSFDVLVIQETTAAGPADRLDRGKVQRYLAAIRPLCEEAVVPLTVSVADFLSPQFAPDNPLEPSAVGHLVETALAQAMGKLREFRWQEGKVLGHHLQGHLEEYQKLLGLAHEDARNCEGDIRARIEQRLRRVDQDLPGREGRFEQEVIYYLEKMDVGEELERIQAHLGQLQGLLSIQADFSPAVSSGPAKTREVGRQMDFLLQEIHRETNTLGAKSHSSQLSQRVVAMKVQLEKMREQAVNLE